VNRNSFIGSLVPKVKLAKASTTEVDVVQLGDLIGNSGALVLGVPGAFTPACTNEHVPRFVESAMKLKRSGYKLLICVVPNDPFTARAWQTSVDPEETMLFLSDGNRDLANAIGVQTAHPQYFLGHSVHRYMFTCDHGRISHFAVERNPALLTCTRPGDLPGMVDPELAGC
jgi:peroxiredoxin